MAMFVQPHSGSFARWTEFLWPSETVTINEYAQGLCERGWAPQVGMEKLWRVISPEICWLAQVKQPEFKKGVTVQVIVPKRESYYDVVVLVAASAGAFWMGWVALGKHLAGSATLSALKKYFVPKTGVLTMTMEEQTLSQALRHARFALSEKPNGDAVASISVTTRLLANAANDVGEGSNARDWHVAAGTIAAAAYCLGTLRVPRRQAGDFVPIDPPGEAQGGAEPPVEHPGASCVAATQVQDIGADPDDMCDAEPDRQAEVQPGPIRQGVVYVVKEAREDLCVPGTDTVQTVRCTTIPRTADLSAVTPSLDLSKHNEVTALFRHARPVPQRTDEAKKWLEKAGLLIEQFVLARAKETDFDTPVLPKGWSPAEKEAAYTEDPEKLQRTAHKQDGMVKSYEVGIPEGKPARGIGYKDKKSTAFAAASIAPLEAVVLQHMKKFHFKHTSNKDRVDVMGAWLHQGIRAGAAKTEAYFSDYGQFDNSITLEDKQWETNLSVLLAQQQLGMGGFVTEEEFKSLQFGGPFEREFGAKRIVWDMKWVTVFIDDEVVWRFSGERGTSTHNLLQNIRDFMAEVIRCYGVLYARAVLMTDKYDDVCAMKGDGDDRTARYPKGMYQDAEEMAARYLDLGRILEPVKTGLSSTEVVSWWFMVKDQQQRHYEPGACVGFPKPDKFFKKSQKQSASFVSGFIVDGKINWCDELHSLAATSLLALAEDSRNCPFVALWCLAWARFHAGECMEDACTITDKELDRRVMFGELDAVETSLQAQVERVATELQSVEHDEEELVKKTVKALYYGIKLTPEAYNKKLAMMRILTSTLACFEPTWAHFSTPALVLDDLPLMEFADVLGIVRTGTASDVARPTVLRALPRDLPGLRNVQGEECEVPNRKKGRAGPKGTPPKPNGGAASGCVTTVPSAPRPETAGASASSSSASPGPKPAGLQPPPGLPPPPPPPPRDGATRGQGKAAGKGKNKDHNRRYESRRGLAAPGDGADGYAVRHAPTPPGMW